MQDKLFKRLCVLLNCIKEVLDIVYKRNLYLSEAKITYIINNNFFI
jgi:hypothetical protein